MDQLRKDSKERAAAQPFPASRDEAKKAEKPAMPAMPQEERWAAPPPKPAPSRASLPDSAQQRATRSVDSAQRSGAPSIDEDGDVRRAQEEQRAQGARQRREEQRGLTVKALCERYRAEYRRPKIKDPARYWRTYGAYIKRGIEAAPIASLPAAAVRKRDVEKWRDEYLTKHYAPRTINVVLGTLRSIYTWALDREILDGRNPCRGVEEVPVTERADLPPDRKSVV